MAEVVRSGLRRGVPLFGVQRRGVPDQGTFFVLLFGGGFGGFDFSRIDFF